MLCNTHTHTHTKKERPSDIVWGREQQLGAHPTLSPHTILSNQRGRKEASGREREREKERERGRKKERDKERERERERGERETEREREVYPRPQGKHEAIRTWFVPPSQHQSFGLSTMMPLPAALLFLHWSEIFCNFSLSLSLSFPQDEATQPTSHLVRGGVVLTLEQRLKWWEKKDP